MYLTSYNIIFIITSHLLEVHNHLDTFEKKITLISSTCTTIDGRTRGALAPTKFISAHRNLVFHNRNVSC